MHEINIWSSCAINEQYFCLRNVGDSTKDLSQLACYCLICTYSIHLIHKLVKCRLLCFWCVPIRQGHVSHILYIQQHVVHTSLCIPVTESIFSPAATDCFFSLSYVKGSESCRGLDVRCALREIPQACVQTLVWGIYPILWCHISVLTENSYLTYFVKSLLRLSNTIPRMVIAVLGLQRP